MTSVVHVLLGRVNRSNDLFCYDTPRFVVSSPSTGFQCGNRSGYLFGYESPVSELVSQLLVVSVDIEVVIYEAMTPQCGRSVHQVLVVRVDIGVVIYEAMTPQCGRSVVQVMVVRVDIEVVIYEAMTPQCGRSVVQVLVVRVDIGVVIYEAMTPHCDK